MHPRSRSRRLLSFLMIALIALAGSASALAQGGGSRFTATPLYPSDTISANLIKDGAYRPQAGGAMIGKLRSVVVKLNSEPLASYRGNLPGLAATSPRVTGASKLDPQSTASKQYRAYLNAKLDAFTASARKAIPTAKVTHRLDVVVGGVTMVVPEDQVATLSKLPDVVAVYPDQLLHLDTDRTPQFIGATTVWSRLGGQESAGEGVIVGVLDTGIWPEHPSFSDPDPSGKPYPAPPAAPGGPRACEFGSTVSGDAAFSCNNKLIGAHRFMETYELFGPPLLPGEFLSARDDNGHGTHTSSTAAGNAGVHASIFGVDRGIISGIAPRAHVMMFNVCGDAGCFSSDSAAAVQQAILDGVNTINFSIGGGTNPYSEASEVAFLDAYNAGVFVAASAGNSGPGADTTDHRGPWVTTVAASTADRAFKNTVNVTASGGASLSLTGTSLTAGISTPTPVVSAGDAPYNDPFCADDTADGAFAGKIVICERGAGIGRVQKGFDVLQRGAVGMILYNNAPNVTDQETDNHFLPTSHIQFDQGQALLSFLASHTNVMATLTAGAKSTQQGDVMASFSSRGGPGQSLGVSKPDITAPGVQILAGHTPHSVDLATGPQGELFQAIAGTSMSSPHIAGSAALIKALHPSWTPGQIKSALMTTAKVKNVVKEDGVTPADAFDYGSGRVDLTVGGNPGLTFDETGANYVALQNHLWDANYPSVYIPVMPGIITVQRTAHSVLGATRQWEFSTKKPSDLKITTPSSFSISAGGDVTFAITIDARDVPIGQTRFATLTLEEKGGGKRVLHLPITIVRNQPAVAIDKTCAPATIKIGKATTCTITMSNGTFNDATVTMTDKVPGKLKLDKNSVVNATISGSAVTFNGTLAAAEPPDVSLAPGSSPAGGYLPLSTFGTPPIDGVDDDTITNFSVPSFTYAGETYTALGVGSNGYLVVGGSTSASDISITNQNFPNPTRPNNVLAGFWTDLDPGTAGAIRIDVLTDGSDSWIVVDWDAVREFSTASKTHSFEIWIGIDGDANPGEDVSFAYGANSGSGDNDHASVGVENRFGNRGNNTYFNGTGTLPADGDQLAVTSTPGAPGGTRVVSLRAIGKSEGDWVNYALMTGSAFPGTEVARFPGTVAK